MNFFKKLFGSKNQEPKAKENPDNTKLIHLLDIYTRDRSEENYRAVALEILKGNSFLMLPTASHNKKIITGWLTSDGTMTLNLTSVIDQDGLKVLGAFTDQNALLSWAKEPTTYASIASSSVINICEQQGIARIVINSGLENMFVMERGAENIEKRTISNGTDIYIGIPARPLDKRIINKLITSFKNISTIEEAYQYLQVANKEASIVLGIKISVISDNSKTALYNAVGDALRGEKTEYPVDVVILTTESLVQTAQGVKNSLFYKK